MASSCEVLTDFVDAKVTGGPPMPDQAYPTPTQSGPEIWKTIPSFPDYEASNFGRIRRDWRTLQDPRRVSNAKRDYLMTPTIDKDGYDRVSVFSPKTGKFRPLGVHQLVAEAFIGPCPEGKEVNHKDSNKHNNVPVNLEYLTPIENLNHKFMNGRCARGERSSSAKLTEVVVREVLEMAHNGTPHIDIARFLIIPPTTVHSITSGTTWSHLGIAPHRPLRDRPAPQWEVQTQFESNRGENNRLAKLTDDIVREARRLRASGMKVKAIAEMFGVGGTTLSNAINGKTWRHVK
jgi:hypothetical protein